MLSSTSRRLIARRTVPTSTLNSVGLRYYHATQKKEIIPVILGVGVFFIGRYSWKAMTRMDEDWEDYQWKLQQYERHHGVVVDKEGAKYPDGTMAIDMGTFYLKLAKDKNLLVTREGGRFTFGGVVMNGDETLVGQRAFEKFYEVQLAKPDRASLAGQDPKSIPTVVQSALDDALERAGADFTKVRPVVTVPPLKWEGYESAFSSIFKDATLVPEPVAAIWGAQAQKELPDVLETSVLVIDIGGLETTLSVVKKNVIVSTTTLEIGGNLFVQAIVDQIASGRDTIRNDGMALQRVYMAAHSAVAEFNTQTHAELHIPYIGMNLETREPEHLEERVARTVIEQKVSHTILTIIDSSKLSTHMPPPTSLSFLWMSVLTQLLEVTGLTPLQLSHVLLVGGGAKHALMESSVKECFVTLQGNADNVVVPQQRSEMVVQGAASMLPNYRYDAYSGLVRDESAGR